MQISKPLTTLHCHFSLSLGRFARSICRLHLKPSHMATRILSNYIVSSRHQLCSLADRETRRDKKEGGGKVERRKRAALVETACTKVGDAGHREPATRCAIRAVAKREKSRETKQVAGSSSQERVVTYAAKERGFRARSFDDGRKKKKKQRSWQGELTFRMISKRRIKRTNKIGGRGKTEEGGTRRKRKRARARVEGYNNAKVSTRGPEENDDERRYVCKKGAS